jgi:spore coat protein H
MRIKPMLTLLVPLSAWLLLASCAATTTDELERPVGGGTEEGTGRFTPTVVRLEIDGDVVRELYTRDATSDDRVEARAFDENGDELELDGGIRFRGSSSRLHPKKSFNIRFEEGQDFLHGSGRMNLKAMYTDPTLMREVLSMDLWHELGHPAPRTSYVDLYINDVYEGLYVHVERVDEDLLAHAGLDGDGTLVRDGFRDNPLLPLSMFSQGFDVAAIDDLPGFLEENVDSRNEPNWHALAELAQWAHIQEPGDSFASEFADRFDVEVFIDWLALNSLIGDVDSFADDYWLYLDHNTAGSRWYVIPWDNDLSFGSHAREGVDNLNDYFGYEHDISQAATRLQNDLVAKVLQTPQLRWQLDDRTLELIERFPAEWFRSRISEIEAGMRSSLDTGPGPGRFSLHPANHRGELGRTDQHTEAIVDFVALRGAHLRHVIENGPTDPGERLMAELPAAAVTAGSRIRATDPSGWTIAELVVTDVDPGEAGGLQFIVEPADGDLAVDRVWRVVNGGAAINGELTVYYRNDVGSPLTGLRSESWFVSTEAVGRQPEMILTLDTEAPTFEPTRVNPMSNKATAPVRLGTGITNLVLIFPERTWP